MSPHLHYQIARARQQEIATRAINSHRSRAGKPTVNRHRSIVHRLAQVVAVLAVCVVATAVVAGGYAHSNQRPLKQRAGRVSAQQLAGQIRTLEAKGFVPTSCTVGGTLMRNYSTGQSVTVKW